MDKISKEQRSALMRKVRNKNTKPEMFVRRLLHGLGLRFRLHRKNLPGKPDIVLPRWKTAIFVHGCFWHRHPRCKKTTTPEANKEFWLLKFSNNKARDRRAKRLLLKSGWKVIVVWECEIARPDQLLGKLMAEFGMIA